MFLPFEGKSPQTVCPTPPAPWMSDSVNPRLWGRYGSSSPRCHLPKIPVAYPADWRACGRV